MSFLARLFGNVFSLGPDPREEWRPLWQRTVAEARDPDWYRMCGVADSVEGRYDMITLVLTLVMLRLEDEGGMEASTARLTELFVEDMEGQMREAGIGDPTVGKMMGRMMATLGGRAGRLRDAMAREDDADLAGVVERNMHLSDENHGPERIAQGLRALHARLARTDFAMLERGEIAE